MDVKQLRQCTGDLRQIYRHYQGENATGSEECLCGHLVVDWVLTR